MKFERYFIVFLLIAATIVLSFFVPPFIAATLIPAVAFGAILLGNPRMFLYIYLAVMSIYPLLKTTIPFGPIGYLNELLGVVLFGMLFAHVAFRRIDFKTSGAWGRMALAMLGYICLTFIMNRGPIRAAVQCLFTYFSFIPLFLLARKYMSRKDVRILIMGTFGFFWLNFILNVTWRLGINPLYNFHRSVGNYFDGDIGTLGGCNSVAYFCAMFIFLLISLLRDGRILGKRWRPAIIVTLVAVLIQFYFTFTNHAYVFFCIAFIPYAFITGIWRSWIAGLAVGVVVLAAVLALSFSEDVQAQFNAENVRFRYEKFSYGAKAQLFNDLLVKNRRENPYQWMFGLGPGNGMGLIGKNNRTDFALKMLLPYYQSDARGMSSMQMTSITGNTTSAVFTMWSDFGLVGFVLFCGLYAWLFLQNTGAAVRRIKEPEGVVSEFMFGALIMFVIVNIVLDVMGTTGVICWIWLFAALLTLPKEAGEESVAGGGEAVSEDGRRKSEGSGRRLE